MYLCEIYKLLKLLVKSSRILPVSGRVPLSASENTVKMAHWKFIDFT